MTSLPTGQWNDKAKEAWKVNATCFRLTRAKKKKAHKAGKCEDCGCYAMCDQPPWCNATSDHHNITYMDHKTKTTKKRPAEVDTRTLLLLQMALILAELLVEVIVYRVIELLQKMLPRG